MIIEKLINTALNSDPKAMIALHRLCGKSFSITIDRENSQIYLDVLFSNQGIQVTQLNESTADAAISGPLNAFILLAITRNIPRATRLGLNFEGDLKTLEIAQQLFFSLDINWEELTSHWTGGIAAHTIGNTARYLKEKPTYLLEKGSRMMAQYITEEATLIPTRTEVESFLENVDTLKADVTRLEMRVARLKQLVVNP